MRNRNLSSLTGWVLLLVLWQLVLPTLLQAQSEHREGSAWSAPRPESLWRQQDSWLLGAALLGTAAVALGDEGLREGFQKNRSSGLDDAADALELLGHPLTDVAIGGALLATGRLRGNEHLAETGLLATEAVIGAEVLVLALKAGVGRQRPGPDDDAASFQPFSLSGDYDSFPSGHTARAFALASVLSQRGESLWLSCGVYGLASLVGAARLVQDEHWASDVLTGAVIGELVGRLTVRWGTDKPWRVYVGSDGGDRLSLFWSRSF